MKAKKLVGILFCISGMLSSLHTISITGNVIGSSGFFNLRLIISLLIISLGFFLLITERLEEKLDEGEFISLDNKQAKSNLLFQRGWSASMDNLVEKIHDNQYKTIFLTQTSTVPQGVMLKEAYKKRYHGEKMPNFLTIDVKEIRSNRSKWEDSEENPAKKMKNYGVGSGDKILLLDETIPYWVSQPEAMGRDPTNYYTHKEAGNILKSRAEKGYNFGGTVGIAYKVLKEAAELNHTSNRIDFDFVGGDKILGDGRAKGIAGWVRAFKDGVPYARRYSGKEERKISKENIRLLKKIGRMSGDEAMREHRKVYEE